MPKQQMSITQTNGQSFFVDNVPNKIIEDFILRNFKKKVQLHSPTRLWLSAGTTPLSGQAKGANSNLIGTIETQALGMCSYYCQNLFDPKTGNQSNLSPNDEYNVQDNLAPRLFKIGNQVWDSSRPKVMGILNVTPDSFYDGGEFTQADQWQNQIKKMISQGADLLDLGGESTRPGAEAVTAEQQLKRILPVLAWIKQNYEIPVSIDTRLVEVARPCLEQGADMINDVSGLSAGEKLIAVVKEFDASYGLMHAQKKPKNMQEAPLYENCLLEVRNFLLRRLETCISCGLSRDKVLVDPGIGFGKTFEHNLDLLNFLGALNSLGSLVLLGTSMKSFIGTATGIDTKDRKNGSLTTQVLGRIRGADLFRVHDVQATIEALKMTEFYINP